MAFSRGASFLTSVLATLLVILLLQTAYLIYLNSSLDDALASALKQSSSSPSALSSHHVKLLSSIPKDALPTPHSDRRLIVVGDIHGMLAPLNALLEEVGFDPERDHLIATGDMISKGPDSGAVVDRLIELGASAVRGNHEDHVLKARDKMDRKKKKKHNKTKLSKLFGPSSDVDLDEEDDHDNLEEVDDISENQDLDDELDDDPDANDDLDIQRSKHRDRHTARSLKKRHVRWLRSLPVILTAEPVLPIYIVHAGLVPGLQVRKQDPWAVMNMRTLRYPKHRSLDMEEEGVEELLVLEGEGQQQQQEVLSPSPDDFSNLVPSEVGFSEDEIFPSSSSHKTPIPTDGRSGQRWADAWNKYQRHIPSKKRRAVIYGHDAKRGHRVGEYTFGLDSGCVVGGKLTAVVITAGDKKKGDFGHETVQIDC